MRAKAEQLAHQARTAVGRFERVLDERLDARDLAGGDHIEVADNDTEQVVEVVRQAAGQLSHRVDPVRVTQLFLHLYSFRDIADRSDDDQALGRRVRTQTDLDRKLAAVLPQSAYVHADAHVADVGGAHEVERVAGMNLSKALGHQHVERPAHDLVGRVAEKRLDPLTGEDDLLRLVDDDHHLGTCAEKTTEFLFGKSNPPFERMGVLLEFDLGGREFRAVALQLAIRLNRVLERRDQQIEDLLFFGRYGKGFPEERYLDAEHRGAGAQRAVLQNRAGAGNDLLGLVGLGQEIVRTGLEPADDIHRFAERGQEHDRDLRVPGGGFDAVAELVAGDARHDDVGDHQIDLFGIEEFERRLAIACDDDGKAGFLDGGSQQLRLRRAVFHDEQLMHRISYGAEPPLGGSSLRAIV